MEKKTEDLAHVSPWDHWLKLSLYIVSGTFLLILFCYIYFSILSSNRLLEVYNTQLQSVEINKMNHSADPLYPSVAELIGKKVYLESQLNMLNSDSVNLLVDLRDSSISLVLDGVTLHSTMVNNFTFSRFFSALTSEAYIQMFSKPFTVENYKSTIVKEPITVKEAPKDTLEAATFFEMPDTLLTDYVAVTMALTQGFILTLRQEEKATSLDSKRSRLFFPMQRLNKTKTDLRRMLRFRLPAYEPEIRVALPKAELVTLFRALPGSTKITIRLR